MSTLPSDRPTRVEVVNFDIPFGQMIWLMIKWVLASIPAMIILFVLGAILSLVFGGVLMGLGMGRFGH